MNQQNKKVKARFVALRRLAFQDVLSMYSIFIKYYNNTTLDIFMKDLSEKEGVFILRARSNDKIVGFSTVKKVEFEVNDKKQIGIFSGDTVLEQHYWGDKSLQISFLKYLIKAKLLNLFRPVYWLLISKGYKTYLLMANNFTNYYPNIEEKNHSLLKKIATEYCDKLFPGILDKKHMLLDFGHNYQKLKQNVAEISDDLREQYPKIKYFEQCNPRWKEGVELPCVSEVSVNMLVVHLKKVFVRKVSRLAKEKSAAPIYR